VATESEEEYEVQEDDTPKQAAQRRYKRLMVEFQAAREELKKFQEDGREAGERYAGEGHPNQRSDDRDHKGDFRLNIFHSDVETIQSNVCGNTPKVDVSRRFGDERDEAARLAGLLLERLLNTDIEHDARTYASSIEQATFDMLVPGFGMARARLVREFEQVDAVDAVLDEDTGEEAAPRVEAHERASSEDVETYYVQWDDCLWSAAKKWQDIRWGAFRCEMSRKDLEERFTTSIAELLAQEPDDDGDESDDDKDDDGEDTLERAKQVIKSIPMNAQRGQRGSKGQDSDDDSKKNWPWDRAEVWEVWDKERKEVCWFVEGFDMVLDCQPDPLQLKGFFPFPEPLTWKLKANKFVPVSFWKLNQSQLDEIDELSTRIGRLERSIQVRGLYDKQNPDVQRLLDEALPGNLIAVSNWAMFAEKGGIKGVVDWFPLEAVIEALDKLTAKRQECIALHQQVSGIGELERGQQAENGTPGEAQVKAQFASARMRQLHRRIERFASELQAIKAEIICKHFSDATILERSNWQYMLDAPDTQDTSGPPPPPQDAAQKQATLQQALKLLRDRFHEYRIQVKPDSVAAEDFGAMKAERGEFIESMGKMLQLAQGAPPAMIPGMLRITKWAAAGIRGGKDIEPVFDSMINAAAQAAMAPQQPQQNPEAVKAQAAQQQAQAKTQEIKLKAQLDAQGRQQELQNQTEQDRAQAAQRDQELRTQHELEMQADQNRAHIDIEKARAIQAMKPAPVVKPPVPGNGIIR
jgi:hypothetical protein